jgi:hypothetical protein
MATLGRFFGVVVSSNDVLKTWSERGRRSQLV